MPKHVDIDITPGAPTKPPKVTFRGHPGNHPLLDHKQGDTVQWHNSLSEPITIAIPWAKHVFKQGNNFHTIELTAGSTAAPTPSAAATVDDPVKNGYIGRLFYLVWAHDSGQAGDANSDPIIEIK